MAWSIDRRVSLAPDDRGVWWERVAVTDGTDEQSHMLKFVDGEPSPEQIADARARLLAALNNAPADPIGPAVHEAILAARGAGATDEDLCTKIRELA